MLVRKGQFLFTCRLAGCWKRRWHRVQLTSNWLTRKKKHQTFALCFVFWMFFITFSLSAITQKNFYVGVFLCHSFRLQTFALCFVFWMFFITFSLSAITHKNNYVGVFLCHSFRMLFRNPLDETGLKKRKNKNNP